MLTQAERVKKIAEILKARFPHLTTLETVDLAFKILEAVESDK